MMNNSSAITSYLVDETTESDSFVLNVSSYFLCTTTTTNSMSNSIARTRNAHAPKIKEGKKITRAGGGGEENRKQELTPRYITPFYMVLWVKSHQNYSSQHHRNGINSVKHRDRKA